MSRVGDVQQMFLVFGSGHDDRIEAFTTAVNPFTRCDSCFAATAAKLASTDNRAPTPARFISMYHDMNETEHHRHVGYSAREVEVGAIEKFWHHDAVQLILPFAKGDQELAEFIAADMWWCEYPATEGFVKTEMMMHFTPWVEGTRSFLRSLRKDDKRHVPNIIEAAWKRARKQATYGKESLEETDFELMGTPQELEAGGE
jgi:hypothetical protein